MARHRPSLTDDLYNTIPALFAFQGPEEWFSTIAAAIRPVAGCDSVTWAKLGFNTRVPLALARIFLPGFDDQPYRSRFRTWYHLHPITPKELQRHPKRKVVFTDEVETPLQTTRLYDEVLKHMGINHQARLVLYLSNHTLIGLGVNRETRPFTEDDREPLTELTDWLARSYRLAEAESRLHAEGDFSGDRWVGQAEVDPKSVRAIHGLGGVIIERCYQNDPASSRRLMASIVAWAVEQRRRLSAPARKKLPNLELVRQVPEGRLVIYLKLTPHSDKTVLLIEFDPDPEVEPVIDEICERSPAFFGKTLSPRRAQTLYWLSRGKTNPMIAECMKVKVATVDKHLAYLYTLYKKENLVWDTKIGEEQGSKNHLLRSTLVSIGQQLTAHL